MTPRRKKGTTNTPNDRMQLHYTHTQKASCCWNYILGTLVSYYQISQDRSWCLRDYRTTNEHYQQ